MPYFPIGQISQGRARLTLTGEVDDATLSFYVEKSSRDPIVTVYADDEVVERIPIQGGTPDENNEYFYRQISFSTQIPAGVKTVELEVSEGSAVMNTILLERDGVKTVMIPYDLVGFSMDETTPPQFIVNGDGTFCNSENSYIDEDMMYSLSVKTLCDIAKRHNVGFMVNEIGMGGTNVYWDLDYVLGFTETALKMVDKYELGWSFLDESNVFPKYLIILYGDRSQWPGATVEEVTYDYGDHTETIKICKELVELFRKHNLGE